jgi:hypothetical protein
VADSIIHGELHFLYSSTYAINAIANYCFQRIHQGSSHFGSSKPSRPYGPKSYKPSLTSSSPVDSTSNPSYSSKSYKPSYTTTRGPSYSSKSYKPSPTSASPSASDRTSRSPSYGSKSYKPSYTTSREPSYSSKSYKPSYTTRSSSQPSKTPTAGSSSRQPSLGSKSYKPSTKVRLFCFAHRQPYLLRTTNDFFQLTCRVLIKLLHHFNRLPDPTVPSRKSLPTVPSRQSLSTVPSQESP